MTTESEYQKKIRQVVVPAVHVLLVNKSQDKVLLTKRMNTGYQDGKWDFPSGHMEEGELPTQAAAREAKEEVGVVVNPDSLRHVHTSFRPKHDQTGNRLDLFFLSHLWEGEPRICEPDKCSEIGWFYRFEMPEDVTSLVDHAVACWTANSHFSELDVRWLKKHGLYKL